MARNEDLIVGLDVGFANVDQLDAGRVECCEPIDTDFRHRHGCSSSGWDATPRMNRGSGWSG